MRLAVLLLLAVVAAGWGQDDHREYFRERYGAIVERVPNGPRTLELELAEATVRLRRPLGGRAVIDTTTGERVRPCAERPCPGA